MKERRLKVPDINRYDDLRSFLGDFLAENRTRNRNFSFRFLGRKLGWSPSFVNHVVTGRRTISLEKTLELSRFLGLKGVRAERLIILSLFNSEALRSQGRQLLALRDSSRNIQTMTEQERGLFRSVLFFQLVEYLLWKDGRWDAEDFKRRVVNGASVEPDDLQNIIQELVEKRFLKWKKAEGRYEVAKNELYQDYACTSDEQILPLEKDFTRQYLAFLEERHGRGTFFSGMVQIPEHRLAEVADRLSSLRNYLYEVNREAVSSAGDEESRPVHQFSLHTFPVFAP